MEQAALLLDAAAEDPSCGSGKPGCRKTSSGPVLDCRVSNYVREIRFYLKPRLETCRFDLESIRTHDNISPREVCGTPMSLAAPDLRLEAICDWKTQTVRQFALTLRQRFEGALNCESGSTDQEDQITWVVCSSRDIDRTLAKEQTGRHPSGSTSRVGCSTCFHGSSAFEQCSWGCLRPHCSSPSVILALRRTLWRFPNLTCSIPPTP